MRPVLGSKLQRFFCDTGPVEYATGAKAGAPFDMADKTKAVDFKQL